jgi:hypothetical protein
VLAKVLLWLHQSCAEGCNLSFGPRIGGAVGVAVLATFVLLRQQNIWLERRCNCNRALVLSSFCIYFVIVAYAKISANLIDAITIKKPLSWLLSQELADYN